MLLCRPYRASSAGGPETTRQAGRAAAAARPTRGRTNSALPDADSSPLPQADDRQTAVEVHGGAVRRGAVLLVVAQQQGALALLELALLAG